MLRQNHASRKPRGSLKHAARFKVESRSGRRGTGSRSSRFEDEAVDFRKSTVRVESERPRSYLRSIDLVPAIVRSADRESINLIATKITS